MLLKITIKIIYFTFYKYSNAKTNVKHFFE